MEREDSIYTKFINNSLPSLWIKWILLADMRLWPKGETTESLQSIEVEKL